jgi:hypothetical protein
MLTYTKRPTNPPHTQVARTADQVRKGMGSDAAGAAGTGGAGVDRDDPSLVAWWRFDEGKGYVIKVRDGLVGAGF